VSAPPATRRSAAALLSLCCPVLLAAGPAPDQDEARALEPITVTAQRVANLQPASTYAAVATALRFDPLIDAQARGLPEGQADITVRGGLFENTAFRIGAVTLVDPQTGHYAADLPIDPAMLGAPQLLTDAAHALSGFNASVATVEYGFAPIRPGGSLSAGLGTDDLRYGALRASDVFEMEAGSRIGATVSAAGSRGDGTLPNGDHDFKRFALHLQAHTAAGGETNAVVGYQDKFFGWPGAYTGFATLPETDHTKLGLIILDHRQDHERGWWEVGTAYRMLEDDYDFDRRTVESGTPGSFDHKTRSFSVAVAGLQQVAGVDWNFFSQFVADELVRSTDLVNGHFDSRSQLSLGVAPGYHWQLPSDATLSLLAGLRLDASNRDADALLPMLKVALERPAGAGYTRFALDLSRSSQLPGYTALNSRPNGLFGGNPDLGREYANTVTLSAQHESGPWQAGTALFYRRDDNLVDWTYRQGAPFARQANPVDIDVSGWESVLAWRSGWLDVIGGYTWMHKDANYGAALVDASYYALNFARHRATMAVVYRPLDEFELRIDSEFRRQQGSVLRRGDLDAFLASLSATWRPEFAPGSRLSLVIDNLTDSDFQEFPGTPAMGWQLSLGLGYDW
jgi:vitamin B12 transporter